MSEATIPRCPSCGAALDLAHLPRDAKCPYCGNPIQTQAPTIGVEDLAAEQTALMNNMFQSALDMQTKQTAVARDMLKSTMPIVMGGTVIAPIVIAVITLVAIACIFGIVWFSISSAFIPFR